MRPILTISLFFFLGAHSSLANQADHQKMAGLKNQLQKIQKQLKEQRHKMTSVKAQVKTIERNIENVHGKHQKVLNRLQDAQRILNKLSKDVAKLRKSVRNEYFQTKKLLASYLVNYVTEETQIDGLYQSKTKQKLMKNAMLQLQDALNESKQREQSIEKMQIEITQMQKTESEIHSFILELEDKKKKYANEYLDVASNKRRLEDQFVKQKSSYEIVNENQKLSGKLKKVARFQSPLKDYTRYSSTEKGVNFYYRGNHSVHAPDAGRVLYVGELASYGQVLMLEHGNQIKSVILGHFVSKMNKGDRVSKGQLLGHAKSLEGDKPLYFEVRKNNVAQNTLLWIDKI